MSHASAAAPDGSRPIKNSKDEAFARESVALDSIHRGYEAAGFRRPRGNAERKARQPHVAARIEFLRMEAAKLAGVSLGRVLLEQSRIAYANMIDYLAVEDGQPRLDLSRLNREQAAAIAEFTVDTHVEHDGPGDKEGIVVTRTRFKLHDKVGALRDLKKHLGGDAPTKHAMTDAEGHDLPPAPVLSPHEAARHLAYALFNLPESEKASS